MSLFVLGSCKANFKISEKDDSSKKYKLAWADEFDEEEINLENWSHQVESAGKFNNELQEYTDSKENSYIENGNLVIEAKYNGKGIEMGNFSSARLTTHGKKEFKFGKISARIKVPHGQGIWPAFWMLGTNIIENKGGTVPWPKCGEIDIMEKIGGGINENTLHGTIHYWKDSLPSEWKWDYLGGSILLENYLSQEYHIYEVEWDSKNIIWLLDGTEYHRQDISSYEFKEFKEKFYILLNVGVGGNWPGSPDESTTFPQKMYVDWVRVYEK